MKRKPKLLDLDAKGKWYVNGAKLNRDHQAVMDACILLACSPAMVGYYVAEFLFRIRLITSSDEYEIRHESACSGLFRRVRRDYEWVMP